MSDALKQKISEECTRQEENANYTAVSLHIWLRELRGYKIAFLFGQLALAGLAAYFAATGQAVNAGIAGALAGISPSVFEALKLNQTLENAVRSAADFTNVRDRFRQVNLIYGQKSAEEMTMAFDDAMDRMNSIRSLSLTPPERIFKTAQKKIKSGDYQNSVDMN